MVFKPTGLPAKLSKAKPAIQAYRGVFSVHLEMEELNPKGVLREIHQGFEELLSDVVSLSTIVFAYNDPELTLMGKPSIGLQVKRG